MASSNNKEGSSSENPKGWSSLPPDLEYDAFLAYLANDYEKKFSELKDKTWLRNDWTHEEDSLFDDLLKQHWLNEELDDFVFKKYGEDEMFRRYGEIAKYFRNRSKIDFDLSFRGVFHTWSNNGHTNFITRKLDRALVNEEWTMSNPQSTAFFDAPGSSDHSP